MSRLSDATYLAFPFRVEATGPRTATRKTHVRGQIEQTLFTAPGERVFRHEFGAGVKRLVFEPYSDALRQMTRKRLAAALADVLHGEVDPKTLEVEVEGKDGRLEISVSYRLATVNRDERHQFTLAPGGGGDG